MSPLTLTVEAPSHSYPIFIDSSLQAALTRELSTYCSKKAAIVSNTTVSPLYLEQVQAACNTVGIEHFSIVLPDGEAHKNWETLNLIFDGLLQNHAERSTTLIALGGGVIGDMVGFAAATYQRGAPFIQIPTTLLSQVDSSVGGKTAINHPLGKNMIGAFYQPQAVFIGLDSLKTLPEREFAAGMAEVIKYALLGDAEFLCYLEAHMAAIQAQEATALRYVIARCCQMKADIVAEDEKEHGRRALLNLGHTFGHAIETEMGYGVWLHGEAVAAGMVLACRLSEQLGHIGADESERAIQLIKRAKLPVDAPRFGFDTWINHMQHDKKVVNGEMRFVALQQLGTAYMAKGVTAETLRAVVPHI